MGHTCVDDIFIIIKHSNNEMTCKIVNEIFKDINFTMESTNDGELTFLEMLIKQNVNGTRKTRVYRKEPHTDQILIFHSNMPNIHKRS